MYDGVGRCFSWCSYVGGWCELCCSVEIRLGNWKGGRRSTGPSDSSKYGSEWLCEVTLEAPHTGGEADELPREDSEDISATGDTGVESVSCALDDSRESVVKKGSICVN